MPEVSDWYEITNVPPEQQEAKLRGEKYSVARQDRLESFPKSGVVWHCFTYHPCEARDTWVAIAHWAGWSGQTELPNAAGREAARTAAVQLLRKALDEAQTNPTSPDYLIEQIPIIRRQLAKY